MPYLMLVVTTLFWGGGGVATVLVLPAAPPWWLTTVRFALAATLFAPVAFRAGRPTRAELGAAIALGIPCVLIYALNAAGLATVSVARASFITGSYAILTPVLGALARVERARAPQLAAAVAALIGLGLLAKVSSGGVTGGDLLVLGSAAAIAVQILVTDRVAGRHDALRLGCLQMAVVATLCAPVAAVLEGAPAFALSGRALLGLGYLVVFSTIAALCLQLHAQRRLRPTTTSVILLLEAPFGAVAGAACLGERMDGEQLAGAAVILAACAFAVLAPAGSASAPLVRLRQPRLSLRVRAVVSRVSAVFVARIPAE